MIENRKVTHCLTTTWMRRDQGELTMWLEGTTAKLWMKAKATENVQEGMVLELSQEELSQLIVDLKALELPKRARARLCKNELAKKESTKK